jgi:hypothetical protein
MSQFTHKPQKKMKKEHEMQFACDKSPRFVTRVRVAYLLKSARSRKGRNNVWRINEGYYIWDAQATITIK